MANPLSDAPDILTHDRPTTRHTSDTPTFVPTMGVPAEKQTDVPQLQNKIPDPQPVIQHHDYFDDNNNAQQNGNYNGQYYHGGHDIFTLILSIVVAAVSIMVGLVLVAKMEGALTESASAITPGVTPIATMEMISELEFVFGLLPIVFIGIVAAIVIGMFARG